MARDKQKNQLKKFKENVMISEAKQLVSVKHVDTLKEEVSHRDACATKLRHELKMKDIDRDR